jgi:hypothetical protein
VFTEWPSHLPPSSPLAPKALPAKVRTSTVPPAPTAAQWLRSSQAYPRRGKAPRIFGPVSVDHRLSRMPRRNCPFLLGRISHPALKYTPFPQAADITW